MHNHHHAIVINIAEKTKGIKNLDNFSDTMEFQDTPLGQTNRL